MIDDLSCKSVRMSLGLFFLLISSLLFGESYFYDSHHVRYELYQTNGGAFHNWLFLPGGPGADSSYFKSLIDHLHLPGNVWLIDLPGNGTHCDENVVDFDSWFDIFPAVIEKFENPILVGHSFGGMFPLLFPELEHSLKGFIILSSAPCLWLEEAVVYAKQFALPDITQEMQEFTQNPSQETFEKALAACLPYYFPPETLALGRRLLSSLPFQYLPAVWWQRKAVELPFTSRWVPLHVPTLIIGGGFDCVCPFTLFQKDQRFHRPNIDFFYIEEAGHFPWVENCAAVQCAFDRFIVRLSDG